MRHSARMERVTDAPPALPRDVAAELLGRWREPHRHHHGERHLREVLAAVDLLAEAGEDLTAVRLATWFHDAVYAGRPDDEERSAQLARDRLTAAGLDEPLVDEVVRLVLLTRTHDPEPADRAGALLSDADLSVLGADPDRYAAYVAGVRREHAHVDADGWRAGRGRVLRDLLGRKPLFHNVPGRQQWEPRARANLAAELADLTDTEHQQRAEGATVIIVSGSLHVAPDHRDAYVADCAPVVTQARDTAGCLDFAISADAVDPTRINVYERWESREAVETFRGSGPGGDQTAAITSADVTQYEVGSAESLT